MATLFWLIVILGVCLTLAYRRVDLKISTVFVGAVVVAYSVLGESAFWAVVLWIAFAPLAALNVESLRREYLTQPLLDIFRTMVPSLSRTERDALESGSVWWEGELFSGIPDWSKLTQLPAPKLTDDEQAFLDGPTEALCRMLDDWEVTHELLDMPEKVWAYIKQERFFAMIIPAEYGGLGFSPLANSMILTKIASRNTTAASTIGVPNSLGPAELLLHYGTDEQKQRWLPGLASGEEIPCFALTSPRAGSDATAIVDSGVICKGTYEGKTIIGIRLNWDKRYITLAPIATVLGLAFKLYDPDHLIGDRTNYGITAALIPTNLPGITIGRRHFPINIPFQNGPTQGKDVFVPLDSIIGGPEMAGQGWRMLVELLSVGRGITLPSNALGGSMAAVYATGAYARIRRQFNLPIGKFHGVGEVLARMAGYTYIMTAASRVTCAALNAGEKPAVPTAILKYHNTEFGRQIANDSMDVHGGKGIMLGPKNYLARNYQSVPIGVTVEGANILTRNLIIFGQGAIRCHPFVLAELEAAADENQEAGLIDFDRLLFRHIGYAISNAVRSLVMGLTLSRFTAVPATGWVRRYYQRVNRYSASFALTADVAMLILGGELKRKELLSARLGDVLSNLYLVSMVLKHYEDQGCPEADRPLVEWSCRTLFYRTQEQLHGFLRNFPNRWAAAALRLLIFPRGRMFSSPSDELGQQIAELIINPTASRERLCADIYKTVEPGNPLGLLQEVLELAEAIKPLERKVFNAKRRGELNSDDTPGQIEEAQKKGVITAEEAKQITAFDDKVMELIAVDDFAPEELTRFAPAARKKTPTVRPAKKKAKRKTRRSDKKSPSTSG
ncbi:MAG: acyl-CoA dehydrogenase [Gammaproteobacteria bacterium]|nr:acyl-CoA dehydrogenase [Gammaproteobacteria bacterium]